MTKTINKEQYKELFALYTTLKVRHKYYNDNEIINEFPARCKIHAEKLDELKVPFLVQNVIAGEGERNAFKDSYNDTAIKNALNRIGYTVV